MRGICKVDHRTTGYGRKFVVESTAYDFDLFETKTRREQANVVDFNKAKKNTSAAKKAAKRSKAQKVNIRTVSAVMVSLLFLGMFGINIYLRGEINEVTNEISKVEKQLDRKESEYTALEVEFDNRVSYKNLESAAAEMGMQKVQKYQVNYISTYDQNRSEEIDGGEFVTADNN